MSTLCIYHGHCADGFTAAWVVRKALGDDVEFYPGVYQQEPPDARGRDVLMVDFSYKRPVIERMAEQANSITILDHHKSAQWDLRPFAVHECGSGRFVYSDAAGVFEDMRDVGQRPVAALFDMDRSGARITWDFFFPDANPPQALLHVEDRDLWRFALDGTRAIQAAIFSYQYEFPTWDWLMTECRIEDLRREGEGIERKHHKDVAELVEKCRRTMTIAGQAVPVTSLPYTLVSDAAHLMAKDAPFAACYWDTANERIFGLRSTVVGADVSEVAAQYGGGGHRHAAGFSVPRSHPLAQE